MIGKIKIGNFTLISVFKHRFEKSKTWRSDFRSWSLGVWFERSMIVGKKDFSNPKKWGDEWSTLTQSESIFWSVSSGSPGILEECT